MRSRRRLRLAPFHVEHPLSGHCEKRCWGRCRRNFTVSPRPFDPRPATILKHAFSMAHQFDGRWSTTACGHACGHACGWLHCWSWNSLFQWKTSMSEWRLPARSLLLGLAVAIANPISTAWSDASCFCCSHVGCNRLLKTGLCTSDLLCRGGYCGCACSAVFPRLHPLWGCLLIKAPH